jgi:hypothetical protein
MDIGVEKSFVSKWDFVSKYAVLFVHIQIPGIKLRIDHSFAELLRLHPPFLTSLQGPSENRLPRTRSHEKPHCPSYPTYPISGKKKSKTRIT